MGIIFNRLEDPKLGPGDIVEVCSRDEILATLDQEDSFEGLPYIPEMNRYCGKRYRVLNKVRKVISESSGLRKLKDTYILMGVTCDGEAHGQCQRTCFLLWKGKWLRRINTNTWLEQTDKVYPLNCISNSSFSSSDATFSCQTTNLIRATSHLSIFNIRQYIQDVTSKTFEPLERLRSSAISLNFKTQGVLTRKRVVKFRGGRKSTPTTTLNLQPGEVVQVKSEAEIQTTLNQNGRNRGLAFTREMLKYCNRTFKVLKRLDRMIIEETGKIRKIANTVLLEGVTCDGKSSGGCQRNCYCLFREIWLKRVE